MAIETIGSYPDTLFGAPSLFPAWFAVQTSSRHEKQVAHHFESRGIQHFLPVYEEVHHWADRRARVTLPLFPGYVFIKIALVNRLDVLQVPGVSRIVSFGGIAVPVQDSELEVLQRGIASGVRIEPHPYLKVGRRVRVMAGPMRGTQGILERVKDSMRVIVSVELIMRSVSIEVDAADIKPI